MSVEAGGKTPRAGFGGHNAGPGHGPGGVGGYYGGLLALRSHEVTFVARGPHLAAMRERGLELRDRGEDQRRVELEGLAGTVVRRHTLAVPLPTGPDLTHR